jgi:RNA polymerase sigma factor (TIGR02999 family)
MPNRDENTRLLVSVRSGEGGVRSLDALFPVVYDELRAVAHRHLARQGHGSGRTLTTTALVHEAYLKLVDSSRLSWTDRAHFFALASRAMRFVLVDHARARVAEKRGGANHEVSLGEAQVASDDRPEDLLAIDEALTALSRKSERLSQLVHYRFFGGLGYDEIAEVTGLSVPTVKRDWARARAWLYAFMRDGVANV